MTTVRCAIISAAISIALLLSGCDAAGPASLYPAPDSPPAGEVSIAYLKTLCRGDVYRITTDLRVSGTVVANDRYGEFYRSIVIVDDTAGLEVEIDRGNLFYDFPIFSRVSIFCNGMALARIGGKTVLGAYPTGSFPIDGIGGLLANYISVDTGTGAYVEAVERRIPDITYTDITSYIFIRDLRIHPGEEGLSWCDSVDGQYVATTRHVIDSSGAVLAVRTDGRCAYAARLVPSGTFTLAGILDYSGGEYWLRIVNMSIF